MKNNHRSGALDISALHLLHRAGQCAEVLFTNETGKADLTPRQYAILASVAQNPDISQTGLVEQTGVDRSTLADIVRRLVKKGLLQRTVVHAGDFMYVPPGTPHLPVNRSDVMTVAVVARTDPQEQESVVTMNLPPHLAELDAFTVANSLDSAHPLGLVSALLRSLRIEWSGILHRITFSNATTRFSGSYVENSATVAVTVETPATQPPFTPTSEHGFKFTSDPAMTISNFAQIGHERNGALFA